MGTALIQGAIRAGVVAAADVVGCDPYEKSRESFAEATGAAGYCLGSRATPADAATAQALLGAVGLAIVVPERLMDAVTGLSGSGPAYIYLVIEAMADGGVRAGIPRADALRLAAQTVLGSAAMVLETGEHPAVLKDMVTSPGGTTIAGLAVLESHGLRSALIEAVDAAAERAAELGR